ncbi:MAG TPA: hypothetical protein VKF60_10380 [Myxococcota bacterium]|nr:hypothetical protein [Myxococcota bacterium]
MRRRLLVTLALAALVSGAACGCGERPATAKRAGDSAETAPGSASGAAAEELANGGVQGVPDDIPIPDGLRAISVSSDEPGSLVVVFTGDLEPEAVARVFGEGLRSHGWSIAESGAKGDDLGVFARKQERIVSVVVTRLSGKLHVELGVWSPVR